jgi:hypothetical protein
LYWRKSIIYVFTVLLPVLMVGISNFHVFPDASLLATLMLVVTAGVAGVFTYFSGDATAKVRRYCILADVVICAILCVNLGGHWILAREVSAARQGVEERHAEEEREERRREADAERQLRLKEAEAALVRDQTKAIREERRRLAQLPREERRSVLKAPPKGDTSATPAAVATIQPLSLQPVEAPKALAPRMTPDEVRDKWWWFLTALAIAECAASVLAGVVLSGVWEWDRNHDGISDHLQNSAGVALPRETSAPKPENFERSGAGKAQKAPKAPRNFDGPPSGQGSIVSFESFDIPSPKTFTIIQSASDSNESQNQFGENVETPASALVDGEACPICGGALEEQSGKHFKRVWCPTPGHLDAWRDAGK